MGLLRAACSRQTKGGNLLAWARTLVFSRVGLMSIRGGRLSGTLFQCPVV